MISPPKGEGVETTLGCAAADRAVADSPDDRRRKRTTDGSGAYRQQPSARRADEAQCLGDVPWIGRATAMRPDAYYLGDALQKVQTIGRKLSTITPDRSPSP